MTSYACPAPLQLFAHNKAGLNQTRLNATVDIALGKGLQVRRRIASMADSIADSTPHLQTVLRTVQRNMRTLGSAELCLQRHSCVSARLENPREELAGGGHQCHPASNQGALSLLCPWPASQLLWHLPLALLRIQIAHADNFYLFFLQQEFKRQVLDLAKKALLAAGRVLKRTVFQLL